MGNDKFEVFGSQSEIDKVVNQIVESMMELVRDDLNKRSSTDEK